LREQLQLLNEAWDRIERSAQEIDQWFDEQRREAIARVERHPGVSPSDGRAEAQQDFLNEKLAAVDADWAAIRRSALEISRWFGDAPPRATSR
jgi:hypothetical protein